MYLPPLYIGASLLAASQVLLVSLGRGHVLAGKPSQAQEVPEAGQEDSSKV